jgi:hypothetical protein
MQPSRLESLEDIAEAPVEELITVPPDLLQQVKDKVQSALTYAQRCAHNQTTTCAGEDSATVVQPRIVPDQPSRTSYPTSAQGPEDQRLLEILEQIPTIESLLNGVVEEILREGVRQKDQDPRLDDVGRLTSPTPNDKLRHLLGCTTLLEDYEHFRKARTEKSKCHRSERSYAISLGIRIASEETLFRRFRSAMQAAKKARTLTRTCGVGVLPLIILVPWVSMKPADMKLLGARCLADKAINERFEGLTGFFTKCLKVYRKFVDERRVTKPDESITSGRGHSTPAAQHQAVQHHIQADHLSRVNATDHLMDIADTDFAYQTDTADTDFAYRTDTADTDFAYRTDTANTDFAYQTNAADNNLFSQPMMNPDTNLFMQPTGTCSGFEPGFINLPAGINHNMPYNLRDRMSNSSFPLRQPPTMTSAPGVINVV